jgi:acyl-CoA synthetase (AMP-forming)/AMP-acid ligase II
LNQKGCLEVRSSAVGATYWPDADEQLGNGLYRTNDLAEIIGGEVSLRGRASDLINVAGRKVSPEAIERSLLAHPAVADCLVFGAPCADQGRGESIIACIASKAAVQADDLKDFLLTRLPSWQVPREWCFVDRFETNQRGKLSRADWRRRYLDSRM